MVNQPYTIVLHSNNTWFSNKFDTTSTIVTNGRKKIGDVESTIYSAVNFIAP